MIRINLLRGVSRKKPKRRVPVSPKLLRIGGAVVGGVVVVGGISVWMLLALSGPREVQEKLKPVGREPSSLVSPRIVEEVVRDLHEKRDKLQREGYLNLPYDQLTFAEKVNYEALFARNACDMIVRVVPEEIGLSSLEIENFQTLYAVGLASSRAAVEDVFKSLKSEKVTLIPQSTFIRSNTGGGYRFAFSCIPSWGLDLTDEYVDLSLTSLLPFREGLKEVVRKVVKLAGGAGVIVADGPDRISADKVAGYRRFAYRLTLTGTFADFVELLKLLYDQRVPCAFRRLDIRAGTGESVVVRAEALITTRE